MTRLTDEIRALVEGLADQQAMSDPWWEEPLALILDEVQQIEEECYDWQLKEGVWKGRYPS